MWRTWKEKLKNFRFLFAKQKKDKTRKHNKYMKAYVEMCMFNFPKLIKLKFSKPGGCGLILFKKPRDFSQNRYIS